MRCIINLSISTTGNLDVFITRLKVPVLHCYFYMIFPLQAALSNGNFSKSSSQKITQYTAWICWAVDVLIVRKSLIQTFFMFSWSPILSKLSSNSQRMYWPVDYPVLLLSWHAKMIHPLSAESWWSTRKISQCWIRFLTDNPKHLNFCLNFLWSVLWFITFWIPVQILIWHLPKSIFITHFMWIQNWKISIMSPRTWKMVPESTCSRALPGSIFTVISVTHWRPLTTVSIFWRVILNPVPEKVLLYILLLIPQSNPRW